MNKEVAIVEKIGAYKTLAQAAAQSGFFKHIGSADSILITLMVADELKIGHMEALMGGITVIQGKAEISPRLMNKMIRQAGHKIELIKNDGSVCVLKGTRNDNGQSEEEAFSIDDARRAGLVRPGGPWEKYPKDMLYARCMSRMGRRLFSDVISTSYVQGEIEKETEVEIKDISIEEQNFPREVVKEPGSGFFNPKINELITENIKQEDFFQEINELKNNPKPIARTM